MEGNVDNRGYDISNKSGERWKCEVTDSYNVTTTNWFETEQECSNQVLYTWDNEKSPEEVMDIQNKAIAKMVERDEINGKIY